MKKTNKKGFTIVELVIVIAVIAILAAVLIPTFSGVIERANESAALSEAKNAMTNDLIYATGDYANMAKYTVPSDTTGKQYYIVSSYKGNTENDVVTTDYTLGDSGFELATGTKQEAEKTYYTLAAFSGVYSSTAGTWTYKTNNGYTAVYTIETGIWKVTPTNS